LLRKRRNERDKNLRNEKILQDIVAFVVHLMQNTFLLKKCICAEIAIMIDEVLILNHNY
jgi:hypothetical protein